MQTPGQQMNQLAQQNSRLANNFKEWTQQNSISALVARVRARSTGAPLPFTSQGPVENSESGRGPAGCIQFYHVAGVLGCLFLIERVRCISESAIKNNPNIWVWILNTPKMLAHLLLVASIWFYLKIATFCLDWCVAGYTLGREYPTMGHGDMFSGIVTPLALSLTFCIMIGKTLAKWLQVHVFPSEPCNLVLAFENHMLHISVQLPWDYGTRSPDLPLWSWGWTTSSVAAYVGNRPKRMLEQTPALKRNLHCDCDVLFFGYFCYFISLYLDNFGSQSPERKIKYKK